MTRKYHDTNNATKEQLLQDISDIEKYWFEHNRPIEGTYCNRCSRNQKQEWHDTVNQNLKENFSMRSQYKKWRIEILKELHKVLTEQYLPID
tara:strand:- start:82 stop:357 length:276 start_codon:yes stop_codon:yes gene_type:complete